jgi:ClpP class serine protease
MRAFWVLWRNRGTRRWQVNAMAQGAWDGGTARQKGLVDQFGGLDEALAWAAGQAGLGGGWRRIHGRGYRCAGADGAPVAATAG